MATKRHQDLLTISERNNRRRKTKDDLYLDVLDAINKPLPESEAPPRARTSPPTWLS